MTFALIIIGSIIALGVIAALLSWGDKDEPVVKSEGDCASCTSQSECKLAELKANCQKSSLKSQSSNLKVLCLLGILLFLTACASKQNTAKTRFFHAFHARYNIYYNGSQAFIEGSTEQEKGHHDNFTEMLPLYPVANKQTRSIGSGQFDRAIEKSEKAIRRHSIKRKPEWNKNRKKTAKDIEWLSRREYNPFIWKAWLLLGKSQFQKGEFEEAAATFSYMSRLYQTRPHINGIARAWLTKSYAELGWLYEAEDVIRNMKRDSMDYRAVKDWDYAHADYYIHTGRYEEAIPYLRQVIKHEKRRIQRAREWFLMGQLQAQLGHREEAFNAFRKVSRMNPPYELDFNARIAQTEVMAKGQAKKMISKLKRMASSDNNKDYLDQVYYAIGNIYLAEHDTLNAIDAYETGNKKATRSGIEKGVLLLKLGDLYWVREQFSDARRCYGEAIGLLDRERPDYEQLSKRSLILDELVPHTEAVHLQDSLQALAKMPEEERLAAIDRVIEALKQKEKEERLAREEAEAEQILNDRAGDGDVDGKGKPQTTPTTPGTQQSGLWYFYNPQAVSQGKLTFERQWGKRENVDNWRRNNRTVVKMDTPDTDGDIDGEVTDSLGIGEKPEGDQPEEPTDSAALDPHNREYYLAQIPFTEEQLAASNALLSDALMNGGVIFKDKLDNLRKGEQFLTRLTNNFPDYARNDEALYHLFLLYSRQGRSGMAQECINRLKQDFPESQWTILLSDPYFVENARFGVHIEDSLYAATFDAFQEYREETVMSNARISAQRFPLGAHRPKFLFIEGLTLLNQGRADSCLARMREVVEKYPESEVSSIAGMIVRGVQEGRTLHGGRFDMADVWSRRSLVMNERDSLGVDTLSTERNTRFNFVLAYQPDSINGNQLLYELARYNFTNYLVRNFEIEVEHGDGVSRMLIRGFMSYDEVRQYVRMLYADPQMQERLQNCRHLIISDDNLQKVGTSFSYNDYDEFYERELAPLKISDKELLGDPEELYEEPEEDYEEPAPTNSGQPGEFDDLFGPETPGSYGDIDFDEDFYR
jgi:tetratricopeptide (TPR) repeat protein